MVFYFNENVITDVKPSIITYKYIRIDIIYKQKEKVKVAWKKLRIAIRPPIVQISSSPFNFIFMCVQ